jgi:predicted metal-dependent peptidase
MKMQLKKWQMSVNNLPVPIPSAESFSAVENYETAVFHLLYKQPFFGKLLMSMKKDLNFAHPTAAVSIRSTGITLHLNPVFFNGLSRKERVAILIHEALHCIHGHAMRFKNFSSVDGHIANVACDIAINQYIKNIPTKMMVPGPDGKMVEGAPITYEILKKRIPHALPQMNAEYYFDLIKQDQKENPQNYQTVDDHSKWEESDMTPEQMEKFTKNHVKAILDTCSDQEKSILDQTTLDELYKSNINWKAQLRSFFANSEETFTETTRKKRNRRYGLLQAGHKNESKLNLALAVDTSGSVSDEWLKQIFGEVERIFNESTMVLHIIEADCVVQNVYLYKKGMTFKPKGRGGTAYSAAFDKAKELGCDGVIYAGDMDCADTPNKPKMNVLWAIVGNQKPPVEWGKAIYIK